MRGITSDSLKSVPVIDDFMSDFNCLFCDKVGKEETLDEKKMKPEISEAEEKQYAEIIDTFEEETSEAHASVASPLSLEDDATIVSHKYHAGLLEHIAHDS